MTTRAVRFSLIFLAAACALGLPIRAEERSMIPEKFTWNLADLYPSDAAWKAAKEQAAGRIPDLARFKGRLGESAATFYQCLAAVMDLDQQLQRLSVYAGQLNDQDTRVSSSLEMVQSVEQVVVQFNAARSWIRPEILSLDPAKVRAFLDQEPRLKDYRHFVEDILRRKPHTLDAGEERVFALAGNLTGTGDSVRSVFANAELPYPEVKLSDGSKVRLDAAAYTKYRAVDNRDDRMNVFQAFFGAHRDFRRTFGGLVYAQVKAHIFNKEAHNFDSSLAASLFNDNVPASVYTQLIADVHANLPTLHRYLKLRARLLGVDQLRYEDLYAPMVKGVQMTFTPEQAMDVTLKAVAPLGNEYVSDLKRGFESRWVDWMPSPGKRSGAYSQAAYGVHPYQLQNFTGLYDEVSTLAHESGHSMHSYLADKSQAYVNRDYATFVAEVASTLNENLLFRYMLDHATDDAARLSILGARLELLRGTLFRQAMFAEFELKMHELAERGESLTGDNLSALYLDLVRTYYGHVQKVCQVDDLYGAEWAYIPHFFWNFYVYQYATSITASTAISARIREESMARPPKTAARDSYLRMLAAGGSKFPIDLLRDAGVDMTTSAPFNAAMKDMNEVMDEMDVIVARQPVKH